MSSSGGPDDRDARDAARSRPRVVRDGSSPGAPFVFVVGVAVPVVLLWTGHRMEARAAAIVIAAAALAWLFRRSVRALMVLAIAALVLLVLAVVPGASSYGAVLLIPAVFAMFFFFRFRV